MEERAWVIGGNRGIGAAIAEKLCDHGKSVLCTDEKDANVASAEGLEKIYSDHLPDYIIYCAGVNRLMPAEDLDADYAMEMMNINVIGFMRVMRLAASSPYGDRPSSVVAISSDAATHPMRNSMAYCASKAALNAAVRCAARELAPAIRVNAVAPGVVHNTGMSNSMDAQIRSVKGWTLEEQFNAEEAAIPMRRRASAREIAEVVYSVATGPQYLTGAIIEVNGGR